MKKETIEKEEFLELLQSQGSSALDLLYRAYRTEFFRFAARYRLSDSDIADIYQDSMIALYENALKGKIKDLKSSLKTYLFAIGKNLIFNRFKSAKRVDLKDNLLAEESADADFISEIDLNYQQQQLHDALNELGGACKELLVFFYYRRFTIESIMNRMNYGSENSVKANKSRCMKKLRALVKEKFDLQ